MDENQKQCLRSISGEVADSVCAKKLAQLLQDADLIVKDKINCIMKTELNFNRNLKLIEAVQDNLSPDAFYKFGQVLERLGLNAPKLLGPTWSSQPRKYSWVRYLRDSLFEKKTPYCLGMNSSQSSSSTQGSQRSTGGSLSSCKTDARTLSPQEEIQSPTLVQSADESGGLLQQLQATNDGGFVLARRNPSGHLPCGQVTLHSSGSRRGSNADENFLQASNRDRPLNLLTSLSLREDSEEQSGEPDEPIVQWHSYQINHDSTLRAASPHRCNPSYSSASSESGESTSDSMIIDQNLILDSNVMSAIARDGPHVMTVKTASVCHYNPSEDYKMTARPRGKCLIVNNIDFEFEMFPTRRGSDEDANRFDQIFQQLGFETIMRRNLNAVDMKKVFKQLAKACKPEHDALFVFILSHGSDKGIYGTDGIEVHLEDDIISCFDNRNCEAMLGKPKVFVIQACRGRAKDFGGCPDGDTTDSIAWPPTGESQTMAAIDGSQGQENGVPADWLPRNPPKGKKRKHPIRTDMLLVFSCLAGFVSVRNETAGSWLGVALAWFIMTHAHERDLLRILNLVTSDIIQRESTHGHIQSIELKLLGWTKNLYFNPGIYQ